MTKRNINPLLPDEFVINKIYIIRGKKIMLDMDLSALYQVETKVLNQAVKRNIERFPSDFMFRLSSREFANLKSQFVTSRFTMNKPDWGGRRKLPNAFTEEGVAMLSSVLKAILLFVYMFRSSGCLLK